MEHLSGPLTAELVELYEDDAMYHFIIALPPDGKPLDQVRVPGRHTVRRGYRVRRRHSEGGTGCCADRRRGCYADRLRWGAQGAC